MQENVLRATRRLIPLMSLALVTAIPIDVSSQDEPPPGVEQMLPRQP